MRRWVRHSGLHYPNDFCLYCRHPIRRHFPDGITRPWKHPDPPAPSVDDLPEQAIHLILQGQIHSAYGLIRRAFPVCEQEDAERLIFEVSLLLAEVSKEQGRF